MKIGKLNEFYSNIGFSYGFHETTLKPDCMEDGNPLKGELLQFRWAQIYDRELAFEISLPEACYVDTLELHCIPSTALQYAKLYCGDQLLSSHTAETGKRIETFPISLEAGLVCQNLRLILASDFAFLKITDLVLYGAKEEGLDLFPTPNAITATGDLLDAAVFTGCCWDSEEGKQAAKLLSEKFQERTGILLAQGQGNICFVTDAAVAADGCQVTVTSAGATIKASNFRGLVYGAETFIKLLQEDKVPVVTIDDSPFKAFRGVHLFIPSEAQMEFAKRLIKYLISPMGYNTVILQVSGGMIYERHPKISEAFAHAVSMREQGWPTFPHAGIAEGKPITKAMLKEYIAYIRSFGIDVIPEVQSLAHVQYLTIAYPEIAEVAVEEAAEAVDTRVEDLLPSQFYRHDYCPSNPRTYEILFDVIDEIIEVFEPKEYVHMGHDEVRDIGVCPRCKHKTPAQLFAEDVNKIYDYLKSKGLKMMMWADMIQPVTKYQTPDAIDMIPKDIMMLDFIWYFHLDKNIEDNLLEKGFEVMFGNLYSSHFPRYEDRVRKDRIHGGQISAWVATNEITLQQEGKFYDLLLTAQLLWAESYHHNFRLCYDRMLQAMMPRLRDELRNTVAPSRQKGAARLMIAEKGGDQVQVNGTFDSLIFSQAALRRLTREPWTPHCVVANYRIRYEDGTEELLPVTYGGNVDYYYRRQNSVLPHPIYRHTGYSGTYFCDSETVINTAGIPETLYIYEYIPAKKPIRSITLEQNDAYQAKVFLGRLEGIQLK